jgi:hypothetical protein
MTKPCPACSRTIRQAERDKHGYRIWRCPGYPQDCPVGPLVRTDELFPARPASGKPKVK